MKNYLNSAKLVLIAAALLTVATGCSKKKSGNDPLPPDVICATTPADCVKGNGYSQGTYLGSGLSQFDITSKKALEFKLAFFGKDASGLSTNANKILIYNGAITAGGTVSVTDGAKFGGRLSSRNTCVIPVGVYTVSALNEANWTQRVRGTAINRGEYDSIELHFSSGANQFEATVQFGDLNLRVKNSAGFHTMGGDLTIGQVNGVSCHSTFAL